MMDFIRNWLVGLVVTGILVSVARVLTPQGTVRRVVQLGGGLVLLIMVVRPLLVGSFENLSPVQNDYRNATESYQKKAEQAGESVMKKLIEDKTSAYIENEAQARGLSIQARVEAKKNGEGAQPLPDRVRIVTGTAPDRADKDALAAWMERTLGIPESQQRWEVGGE